MISQTLILKKYFEVKPWDGVNIIQPKLLCYGFAVVIDENGFWGILTTNNILKKNHRLVIDCLEPTIPFITENDNLPFVLDLMYSSNNQVLPYINKKKFIGVITRNQITTHYQNSTEQLNKAITELNSTNKKLKESEEKYRLLVESLNEGVWQIDENFNTIFVNSRMAQMLGYSVDEMIGKPNYHFADNKHKQLIINIVKKKKTGATEQHELEFIRKDGTKIITIIDTSPVYDEKGDYQGAIAGVLDISDRKKSEFKLEQTQQKLKAIIDNVPAAIFWKDSNNRYLGCNINFADYVNIPRDKIFGKTDNEMPWKDYQQEYIKEDQSVFRTGKSLLNYEKRGKNLEGKHTWFRVSKVPLLNQDGTEVVSVIGIFEDITDQKQKDYELQEYRDHLKQLVKERTYELHEAQRIANIGNWKNDVASNTITWSDHLYHIYGTDKNSFTPNSSTFSKIIHPDDLEQISKVHYKSIKNKTPYALEHRIINSKGDIRWVTVRCEHHFDENGNHSLSVGTVQDITPRKKLEIDLKQKDAEFEIFFENINDVVLIFDADGNTVYVNKKFETVFKKTITEQRKDPSSFLSAIHPDDAEKFSDFFSGTFSNREDSKDSSFEFRVSNNNQTRWLNLKRIPVEDNNTRIIRLILLITDITKSKQMQREILSAIINAEEKERIRLAQDLHDGIGPLLSTTKLYLQLLSKPGDRNAKENFAEQAKESIDEAIKSVREISHNLSPSLLTRFGLISAIKNFINRLQNSTSINFSFNHMLTNTIQFEIETTIYRIFVEATNNALRHAKATKIIVELFEKENKITLKIDDNGVGFDVEKTLKNKSGLGLININNRAENIGGLVDIKSNPTCGTRIYVTIPIPNEN